MSDSRSASDIIRAESRLSPRLDLFLNPTSIAVIGASDDPSRIGGRTIFNIKQGGFAGAIYPINPGRETVQGLPAFPDIEAVPGPIDCAVIALPAERVIAAAEACGRKKVRALVIFSAGFNEAGEEGIERQRQLAELAAESGMRIIGPNCLGLFNSRNGTWLSFTSLFQPRVSGPALGMISQSGGSAAHVLKLAQARGLAIGTFITTGNEVDVEFGEGLMALAADPDTSAIIAYIEGVRNGGALIKGLEAARRAGKPVLMLKVGRTSAGAQAAASHTASLAGEDRVYDAIFRAHGVYRAHSTEELLDVACATSQVRRFPTGDRLGVVTISGGMGAQIADAACDAGLTLPAVPDDAQARLKALCPPGSPVNPVDITAQLSTDPHLLGASMRELLATGEYDALLAFFGVYANVPALSAVFLEDLRALRADFPHAVMVVSIVCPAEEAARYAEAGYLVFEEPARAVRAMAALRSLAAASSRLDTASDLPTSDMPRVARGVCYQEASAKALLAEAGIRSPVERLVTSVEEIDEAAPKLRFPVALKIVSPDVLHKTEVGGVALGLASPEAASAAATDMLERVRAAAPDARIEGLLLSEMAQPGVELILGTRRDPLFGPLVMVGLGGVTAELFQDVAIRSAPVDAATAEDMLRTLKSFPLLDGWRGAPKADIAAAAAAIACLSMLAVANADSVETIEINPLRVLASGKGVLALDAVIETAA
ncbi:MAG: acetate--CoA ligase family protein [Flavobacteriaceae bacterium]